jgi:hypothetical protein
MPPEKKSSVQDFFDNLPDEDKQEADILDSGAPKTADDAAKGDKGDDTDDEKGGHKNRKHRRLEAALEREKEARIAAEARANALSENGGTRETRKDIDTRLTRVFGDTDDAKAASQLFQELLDDAAQKGKDEALREMKDSRERERKEQVQFETFIDTQLESIEDEFNVDVTSNAPAAKKARREFLEMVQKLSPKDESGTITGYADFGETWELYQDKRKTAEKPATADRQKDLAARSMERSNGGAPAAKKQATPGFFGWKNDLKL